MQVYLLGAFQAIRTGEGDLTFRSDSERALLAYLAVESHRPHRRDVLGALLWPETSQDQARNNLRVSLYRLKQSLETDDTPPGFLVSSRTEIQVLQVEPLWVDYLELAAMIDQTRRHDHADLRTCAECAADLDAAVQLYRGEFLEGFSLEDSEPFEAWVRSKREWAHRSVLGALFDLAEGAFSSGEPDEAEAYARRQLEMEPWREKAHRQLMIALALRDERPAALAQYTAYVEILAEELGAEPSSELEDLYDSIRSGNLEEAAFLPPPAAPGAEPGPGVPASEPAGTVPPPADSVPAEPLPDAPRGRSPGLLGWFFLAGVLLIVWLLSDRIVATRTRYDGFDNPVFDGSLDPQLWFFPHALPDELCAWEQVSGELALIAGPDPEARACVLRVAVPETAPGSELGEMEVKMRADNWDPAGSMGVALRVSASFVGGDWSVDCGLAVDPDGLSFVFSVSDTRLPEVRAILTAASRPVAPGTWYPVRLEVDPGTMEAVCLLEGEELGRFQPDDPEELRAANFVRELLPWESPGVRGEIRLDDFRIDAPPGAPASP